MVVSGHYTYIKKRKDDNIGESTIVIIDWRFLMGKRFQISILENCNYTKSDKFVEALLMAKVLTEKIGGKTILELI